MSEELPGGRRLAGLLPRRAVGLGQGNSGCAVREVPRGGCSLPRGVWLGAPPALAAPPGGRQRCWGPRWVLGPIQFSPRCRSGALRAGCPRPWPDARAPQTVPGAVSRVGRLHAQPCPLPAEPCRAAMGSCAAGTGAKGSPSSSPGPRAPGFTGRGGKGAVGWRSQGSGAKGRLLVPPKAVGWWYPGVQGGGPFAAELGDGAGSGRCRGAAAASRCGASASQRRLVINWQEQGVSARRLGCEDYRGRDFNRARIRSQRSLS